MALFNIDSLLHYVDTATHATTRGTLIVSDVVDAGSGNPALCGNIPLGHMLEIMPVLCSYRYTEEI